VRQTARFYNVRLMDSQQVIAKKKLKYTPKSFHFEVS